MAAFVVISLSAAQYEPLNAAVAAAYENNSLRMAPYAWLVADTGVTTQEVCKKLTIEIGKINSAIVIKIESYFGLAPRNIWEWLNVKGKEP